MKVIRIRKQKEIKDPKREVVVQYLQRCKDAYEYSRSRDRAIAEVWHDRMNTCEEILKHFDTIDLLQI